MRRTRSFALGLTCALGVSVVAHAQSAGQCAPNAITPPLLNQTTSNWGAPTVPIQMGSSSNDDELRVRVDKTNRDIYVSWTVNTPMDINAMAAKLLTWIGIANGNTPTSSGVLFRIDLLTSGNPPATNHESDILSGPSGLGSVLIETINGATEGGFGPVANVSYGDPTPPPTGHRGAWLNVIPSGGNCSEPPVGCNGIMNVEMRIPTHAGAPLIDANGTVEVDSLDNFFFWSQVTEPLPLSHDSVVGWPQSINAWTGAVSYDGGNAIGISGWGQMFTAPPQVAECQNSSGTVVIDPNFIGRIDPSSPDSFSTNMLLFGPSTTPLLQQQPQTNRVAAYLFNGTGQPIAASDVQVVFKFATWGSQAGAFVPLDATNNKVTLSGTTKQYGTGVPAPAVIAGSGTIPTGGFTQASLDWTPDISFACQFHNDLGQLLDGIYTGPAQCPTVSAALLPTVTNNDSLQLHQCVQVTAHSIGGHFPDTPAIQRNMDFVNASHFQRDAVIDTKGLRPLKGKKGRYVYLYLETRNMPAFYKEGGREFAFPKRLEPEARIKNPRLDDWRATFPTYMVHVYHETGRFFRWRGHHPRQVEVLEPQQSFGYYVAHTGSKAFGWRPELSGAQEIAPNFYRIFVRNNGKAVVHTGVEALERPPCFGRDCKEEKDKDKR